MEISASQIKNWVYGGDTFELRLFYNRTWTDEDGQVRLQGEPGPGSPCTICPGTVDGADGTILSFAHPPTTTSPDYPRVRVTGVIFDENGGQRHTLFSKWVFPDESAVVTLKWLSVFNRGVIRRLADKYLTRDQVLSMLADFVGTVLAASRVVMGAVFLDIDPDDANAPTAVGANSDRLMRARGVGTLVFGEVVTIDAALVEDDSPIECLSASEEVRGRLRAFNRIDGATFDVVSDNPADAGDFVWFLYR